MQPVVEILNNLIWRQDDKWKSIFQFSSNVYALQLFIKFPRSNTSTVWNSYGVNVNLQMSF